MSDCIKCKYWITLNDVYYQCQKGCEENAVEFPLGNCPEYEEVKQEDKTDGKKYDSGKNRMGLMCEGFSRALWEVARVSTFGSQKYGDDTWQNLSNPKKRYMDALCRHLFQHLQGNKVDSDSGLLHLQHMCWNALCLLEFELKDNNMTCALKQSLDKVQEDMKVGGILKALKESEEE